MLRSSLITPVILDLILILMYFMCFIYAVNHLELQKIKKQIIKMTDRFIKIVPEMYWN